MKKVFLLICCLGLLVAGIISSCTKEVECECFIVPGSLAQELVDKHSKNAKSCADLESKIKAESGVESVSCSEK